MTKERHVYVPLASKFVVETVIECNPDKPAGVTTSDNSAKSRKGAASVIFNAMITGEGGTEVLRCKC